MNKTVIDYSAVIFDLGNTLVSYYSRSEWPAILDRSIRNAAEWLTASNRLHLRVGDLPPRVQAERGEADDCRVRPLIERLRCIFGLADDELDEAESIELCRQFMAPTWAVARRYEDVLGTLAALRARGVKTGILSNTPWGSPAELWYEELRRHELLDAVDAAAFCVEAGWRKPDERAFRLILGRLGVTPAESLFIGDDPRWDIAGPARIGMAAILIDRAGAQSGERVVHSLAELLDD